MARKMIIIGAGVAGLSAGVYGRLNGFDTEIYEMHTLPGGECTGWKRKDYYFDGCIHWLVGSKADTAINKIWREVGALDDSIPIVNHEILYCYEEGGRRVNVYADADKLEKHFRELSPQDADRIAELGKAIKAMECLTFPTHKPFDRLNAWDMMKLIRDTMPAAKYLGRFEKITVEELVAEFKSPLLRNALARLMPGFYKATALVSTLAGLNAGDNGWPTGGSLAFAGRMEKRYRELGGKVFYKSRVDKILVENGRAVGIQLSNGQKCTGDYVISTADGHATLFNMLDGKYLDDNLRTLYSDQQSYPVYTTVQVSLGINCDLSKYPHTLYFQPEHAIDAGGIKNTFIGLKHFCYDPTLLPPGKSVITMVLNADYEWWENKHRDKDAYQRAKEQIAGEVRALVEERYPETKGQIEVIDVATPMTYVRYCNAWQGAWMAWGTTPRGKIRYVPGMLPGLKNFYLSGQWTMPPGGLPTAVVTGRWVIQRICGLEKRAFITA